MSPAPRFRFSLETVLQVRLLREEQARQELARAHRLLERSLHALADTEQRRKLILGELAAAEARDWDCQEFQWRQLHLESLHIAAEGWKETIDRQRRDLESQRQALLAVHRERRLLEILRTKQAKAHHRALVEAMDKENEAITLGRWLAEEKRGNHDR